MYVDRGNYGKALLELCKNYWVCIYNGQIGSDKGIGKETTTDGSVIDYVITSPFVISKTTDFVVHDFGWVFSDKHSLVTWQMQSQCNINNLNVQQNQTFYGKKSNGRIIWRNDMRNEYIQHICKDRIEILLGKIETSTVQEVTNELNEYF